MIWLLAAITVVVGILRFTMPVSGTINVGDIYKDLAHLWVGFLFGLAIYRKQFWILAIGITILEVVAFIIRRST